MPVSRSFALVTLAFFSLAAAGSDPGSHSGTAPSRVPSPRPADGGPNPETNPSSDARGVSSTNAAVHLVPVSQVNPAAVIAVDAGANRHSIDPRIYGLAFATTAQLADLGATINRWGGNATSRHNWAISTTNRCKDYFFENIPDTVSSGDGSNGKAGDDFIGPVLTAGAQPIMTIPMMGILPKDRTIRCGYSIAKYGAQDAADPFQLDCGSGKSVAHNRLLNINDPADTSATYPASHQANWVQHIVSTFGPASTTGVRYYALDNEPVLWSFDHWDVHPNGSTYDEVWGKMAQYGAAIKAVDPGAQLSGIEEWGWSGYFDSGLDAETGNNADRVAHGNVPYAEWLLQQARTYEQTNGQRILDIAAVHFYPQGDNAGHYEFSSPDDTTGPTQLLRNRSTRSLWDPNYVDASWIGGTGIDGGHVRLIPRLKEWTSTNYPGTKNAITEYNWGAEGHINGATAQADILGIFGREGLDIGVRWTTPATNSFAYNAFKIYRNYDAAHSGFGDQSISATAPDPDTVATFASLRSSDGAMTVMVIAKSLTGTTPVTVNLANFTPSGAAQRWQMDSTVSGAIVRQADVVLAGSSIGITVPAQSITLLVIPGSSLAAPSNVVATATSTSGTHVTWSAVPGAVSYQVYRSSLHSAFAPVGGATAGTSYDEAGLSADTTFLYEVRASSASISSSLSAPDPATTILFADDPASAGIPVKAQHITQLRTAVNAMRAAAGLAAQTFTDAAPLGLPVQALHLVQLRVALDQARATILAPIIQPDPSLTPRVMPVKATHIQALRNGVK